MSVQLRDYQKEALKKIISVPNSLVCVKVGKGKTLSSIAAASYFFKKDICDKAIFAGTKTSINAFVRDFKKFFDKDVEIIEDVDKFINFFKNNQRMCIIKHSMFEKIGKNYNYLQAIELALSNNYKRVYLALDEAHALSNAAGVGTMRSSAGVGHSCFERCRFMFSRITLMTATPYSSCLTQLYGLVHLIYPSLWEKPKEFWDNYIEVKEVRDWKTHKFQRYDKVAYKNLLHLRKVLEQFTYFYYPPVKINFVEHYSSLKDYTEYNRICSGLLTEEEKLKLEEKRKEKLAKMRLRDE